MHSLKTIWLAFFNIARLRSGPQNLPTSSRLLNVTLLAYIIISSTITLMQLSAKEAILTALIDAGLLVLFINSLFYIARYPSRITQTITALAGVNCVFEIISIPLVIWITVYTGDLSFPVLLILCVIVWKLAVYAHILREALGVPFFMGLILTIIMSSFTLIVLNQVIPFVK